jgi:hypothetical protein
MLKLIHWIDNIFRLFGSKAFKKTNSVLKVFDSASPLDENLGTDDDLKQLRNLVKSYSEGIDNNPFLSSMGRYIIHSNTIKFLKARKDVLEYYHANKEFIENKGKLKAPVLITGMSRSGTTLLHRLMSEDPNTRSPYTFEMEFPIPPTTLEIEDPLNDPRIKRSNAGINALSRLMPGFIEKLAESHLLGATEKEESLLYMWLHNGVNVMNAPHAGKIFIDKFIKKDGARPIFRYERMFFTMLDAFRPAKSHWTLKAPNYATVFPLVFEIYPDAKIVLTHRNPLITLPSVCRLLESWCIAFDQDGSFDKYRFAPFVKPIIDLCIDVPFVFRKEHPEKENQIFDCMYETLFSDPISVVKEIYTKFDLEFTQEFENRMRVYLENNKQGKYGRHKYSLEEYGLDKMALYKEYKEYMEHYGYGIPDKIERPISFDFPLGSEGD